jgi:hypothetical protein
MWIGPAIGPELREDFLGRIDVAHAAFPSLIAIFLLTRFLTANRDR